jgi:hypothetical protein
MVSQRAVTAPQLQVRVLPRQPFLFLSSSKVEQLAVNQMAVGASPT